MIDPNPTCMKAVPGTTLSKLWFTASTRKLESIFPFLSEEDQEKVCEELHLRDAEIPRHRA